MPFLDPDGRACGSGHRRVEKFVGSVVMEEGGGGGGNEPGRDLVESDCGGDLLADSTQN